MNAVAQRGKYPDLLLGIMQLTPEVTESISLFPL